MQTVTVGALDNQGIGPVRRLRRRQQRRMGGAQIAGEQDAALLAGMAVMEIDLHIGRAENVPGSLQRIGPLKPAASR